MQIIVKRISGKVEAVTVSDNETAGMLMNRLGCGKLLAGCKVLGYNEAIVDSTLFEMGGLEGGKNKKSKKKDTSKPKHKKHVNKKVKLACLTHYNVTSAGKVERLRKCCANKKCGVACFLAQHKDRLTCGKCHTHIPKTN
ncbi:ribosomal protein s27a domain containing protein [Entamoeba histolytica HM-1:IMSS-B]|uniref:40S ribosomal protein S27a, putative n=7 Tax=Entamoeba TaxID=5758 RepID=C4M8F6_ENTH1|nr:40S ribosomal protein S27a, putative [Entamoeba histolytica HM-1:IMSS]EMD44253.1 40S ribosomal protein S27a [Entamoeba histolytica KU27]EMH73222.1 ribosomal protein s27a domain containing protein [Entamoeba histolytica HM-1:IMSS-B]EMS16272.1 40S ribosomal protein S27a, putative [Entamoeba histolytica HM-3:IMSS]ENY60861.1 40S ribosomal protein S27a, putative [Entamoeba histolytica HM-1:IMSS-A]GAT97879.1 40S ribosomal protein s27a putative [Entamoeba histolytica]|eukprot:XP_651570.1 40S ribosomal protein S27a, putative [Entamoeba histolytica HM-1:IMSS]